MTLPRFYESDPNDEGAALPISILTELWRSDQRVWLVLMALLVLVQLLALIPLWRRPLLASVILFFIASFSSFLVGVAALLFRLAAATQSLHGMWEGRPFPHQLIHAECIAAIGALATLCSLVVGLLFYAFRWRHSVAITYFESQPAA